MISLIIGSVNKVDNIPLSKFPFQDKGIHFTAYFILCFLLFLMLKTYNKKQALLYSFCLALIFGTILELLQPTVTSFRTFDPYDLIANTLGVFVAYMIIKKNKKGIVKKIETFM